ncbi:MAG: hypothetical protein CME19_16160 [Gemmatimonadetes bacterium]|nr:hypothetical protein [Gemmatimonadota bacterium]
MNLGLSTVDLGNFVLDEGSYLGQTLKYGIEYGLLPENADDALRMYLQMHTMSFGQKNRSGIAINREDMEQGIFQATVCLDIGLRDQSKGEPNRAAEILSAGEFEAIRKRGWELAFFWMEDMHEEGKRFPMRRESAFLMDYATPTQKWAHTVPETWICDDPEAEGEPTIVDPVGEYDVYLDLMLRVSLLKRLPADALKRFGSAAGARGPFCDLLRNLIVSVSLGLESLVLSTAEAEYFRESPFGPGMATAEEVLVRLLCQLEDGADPRALDRFGEDVREEVAQLVSQETGLMTRLAVVTG